MVHADVPELTREQVLSIAKALADPRRYEILQLIGAASAGQPCSVILDRVAISPATLSHHMKELETSGLIRAEREGKTRRYFLLMPLLRAYLQRLQADLT